MEKTAEREREPEPMQYRRIQEETWARLEELLQLLRGEQDAVGGQGNPFKFKFPGSPHQLGQVLAQ